MAPPNGPVVWLLTSPLHGLLSGSLDLLRYRTADGREVTLPTQYALADDHLVVLCARAAEKRWWRHFRTSAPADVCLRRQWHWVDLVVVDDPDRRAELAQVYVARFPKASGLVDDAVVLDGRFVAVSAS